MNSGRMLTTLAAGVFLSVAALGCSASEDRNANTAAVTGCATSWNPFGSATTTSGARRVRETGRIFPI